MPSKHWKICLVFHAMLLNWYYLNQWYGKAETAPVLMIVETQEEYEVECVLNHQ